MSRGLSVGNYLSNTASAPVTVEPLSILLWVYPTVVGVNACWVQIGTNGSLNNGFMMATNSGNQVRAISRTTANNQAIATGTISANTWNHAAGVFVSTTERHAYRDGGAQGSDTTLSQPTAPNSLYFGTQPDGTNIPMTGRLAEVAIWSAALTPNEVAAHARGADPRRIRPASLVGYWPIWGQDSPEPDLSRGVRNLTLTGTPPYANHAPVVLRVRPSFAAEASAVNPIYTQTKFRVYNDDGTGLGP